jgi:hypothetical protein
MIRKIRMRQNGDDEEEMVTEDDERQRWVTWRHPQSLIDQLTFSSIQDPSQQPTDERIDLQSPGLNIKQGPENLLSPADNTTPGCVCRHLTHLCLSSSSVTISSSSSPFCLILIFLIFSILYFLIFSHSSNFDLCSVSLILLPVSAMLI